MEIASIAQPGSMLGASRTEWPEAAGGDATRSDWSPPASARDSRTKNVRPAGKDPGLRFTCETSARLPCASVPFRRRGHTGFPWTVSKRAGSLSRERARKQTLVDGQATAIRVILSFSPSKSALMKITCPCIRMVPDRSRRVSPDPDRQGPLWAPPPGSSATRGRKAREGRMKRSRPRGMSQPAARGAGGT